MNLIGSKGQEIPCAPSAKAGWARVYVVVSLWMTGLAAAYVFLLIFKANINSGQTHVIRRLPKMLALCIGFGFAMPALVVAVSLSAIRRSLGAGQEQRIWDMPLDKLDAEIAAARTATTQARSAAQRTEWSAWLAWLEDRKARRRTLEPASPTTPADSTLETCIFRPTFLSAAIATAVTAPLPIWMVWIALKLDHSQWFLKIFSVAVAIFFAFFGVCSFTQRLELTPRRLVMRDFWRTQWSVPREGAELHKGLLKTDGGDLRSPGYRVIDTRTGAKLVEFSKGGFRLADLDKLEALLPPRRS